MNRQILRCAGAGMYMLAMLAIGIFGAAHDPAPVEAAPLLQCCQECEGMEEACLDDCDGMTHGQYSGDTIGACYQDCTDGDWYYDCYSNCYYCDPPDDGPYCFAYAQVHHLGIPKGHRLIDVWEIGCSE